MSKNKLVPYRPLEMMRDTKLTPSSFDDFIGVWPNFIPKPFCDRLIQYGEAMLGGYSGGGDHISPVDVAEGLAGRYRSPQDISEVLPAGLDNTQDIMHGKHMYSGNVNRDDSSFLLNYADANWNIQCNQFLKSCVTHYLDEYSQLQRVGLMSTDNKFQKTPPGGGYHTWHYENGSFYFAQREITWMAYLNDIDDGGETEFLYQKRRIKPTQGTIVLFPAGYTHVHRGGLVLGEKDKYIITGWYIKTGDK